MQTLTVDIRALFLREKRLNRLKELYLIKKYKNIIRIKTKNDLKLVNNIILIKGEECIIFVLYLIQIIYFVD